MLKKSEKIKFVEANRKAVSAAKLIGIVNTNGLPDRLLQSMKNRTRGSTRFIMGRKTLLTKILEGTPNGKALSEGITGTSAIIISDADPFELYNEFRSGAIKLAAKPGQTAPEDVEVKAGETSIMPGQTVTELKSAGIDVQIQKGKVVIAKDKVIVKKGSQISPSVAKALRILDVMPFNAVLDPSMLISGGITFTRAALGITRESVLADMTKAFGGALAIALQCNIVNQYTINSLITKAYSSAVCLGVETKVYDSGIIERLISGAAASASALSKQ